MKIVFLIGGVAISGGNYVTFQHALYAKAMGHDVTIAAMHPWTEAELTWHPALSQIDLAKLSDLAEQRFDIAIATWWRTALRLAEINAEQYAYFVQSIESRFFPAHQQRHRDLVDGTYRMGLPVITEASWIKEHLHESFGTEAYLARNGILKSLYTVDGDTVAPRVPGRLRILVEGPFGVPIKNTARTVRLVREAEPAEIWLLTSSKVAWYPGVDRVFSQVPIQAVPPIYRSCDVIVKLSYVEGMFGPPLEMFHCGGTAIVYSVSGHDEYIVPNKNALVLSSDDEAGVVAQIRRLIQDQTLLRTLKDEAEDTARGWPDWNHSSSTFLSHLEKIVHLPSVCRTALADQSQRLGAEYANELATSARSAHSVRGVRGIIQRAKAQVRRFYEPHRLLWSYIQEGKR
jgi:hypothetical protein